MNDPIREAENGIATLETLETIAMQVGEGRVRVTVHAGKVTSIVSEKIIDISAVPNAGIIAELATMLGYGGLQFAIADGKIADYQALPKRRVA